MDDRPPEPDALLPEDLIPLIKPELLPGERLLWASRAGSATPSTGVWPSPAVLIWFLGFASVSVASLAAVPLTARGRVDGSNFLVTGLGSGVIAFFFVVGYVSGVFSRRTARRKLQGQVYALTDRRAIIWVPSEKSAVSVYTYQKGTIRGEHLHRIQYPGGSGDVLLGHYTYNGPSGFLGIAEVRRVEELVRRFLVDPNRKAEPIVDEFLD